MSFLCALFLLNFPFLGSSTSQYYWREYTGGDIPKDAFIGGRNENWESLYIGQVYAGSKRLMVTELHIGQKDVIALVPEGVIKVVDRNIKILCGVQDDFFWIHSNETGDKINESTVNGGHLDDQIVLIGRVRTNGVHIGGIFNSRLHWEDQTIEKSSTVYQILSYQDKTSTGHKKLDGYYWRDYNGMIPNDAIVGGRDINRKNLFIGQADTGSDLSVVRIFPGVTEVEASHTGNRITNHIKILCGHAFWKPVSAANLHLALIRNEAVIGGHKKNEGYLAIGRVNYENEIKIGQIPFYSYTTSALYFSDRGYVKQGLLYEILIARVYNSEKK